MAVTRSPGLWRLIVACATIAFTLSVTAPGAEEAPDAVARRSIAQLGSARADDRADARARLLALGSAVVPLLIEATASDDATVRWEAVNLLGLLDDPRGIDAVFGMATTDPDVHARWRANWALARLDDGTVAARLVAVLAGDAPTLSWNAAVALSLFGGLEAVPTLHRGLDAAGWQQWEAVNALGRIWNDETPARLAALLRDASEDVRQEAALSLGWIGGPIALAALLDAVRDDPSYEVRWRAVMMIGRIGDAGSAAALAAARATETDPIVLDELDRAIERLGGVCSSE